MVPFAESDFIYASLGEELGMAGLFVILLCYLFIFQRGIKTAQQLRDGFGTLLATGLSFTIALQVFVVVGGVTRLIPLTGLTTPFLAQGGSSLIANWMIIGLLLRISDNAQASSGGIPHRRPQDHGGSRGAPPPRRGEQGTRNDTKRVEGAREHAVGRASRPTGPPVMTHRRPTSAPPILQTTGSDEDPTTNLGTTGGER